MPRYSLIGFIAILAFGFNAVAFGQTDTKNWRFNIQASVEEDLNSTPGLLYIGTDSSATDGYDQGTALDQATPGSPADNPVFIASVHATSETGYSGVSGSSIYLSSDIRAPIQPGGEKIWKIDLLYNNILPGSATMLLTWPDLSGMPSNFSYRIGNSQDFLTGASQGTNMRANRFTTFKVTPYTSGFVEIHVKDTGSSAQPYINIAPHSSQIQAGNQLPLLATSQNNTSDPVWTVSGGTFTGSGSRIVWTAPSTPGTYSITATVQGQNGSTASDTATVQVSTTPVLGPDIQSINPIKGAIGTKVTLTGVRFASNPTDNQVSFQGINGGILAQIDLTEEASTTKLTVIVPPAAMDGPITITTAQGSDSSETFTVIITQTDPTTNIGPISPRMGVAGVSIIQLQNPNSGALEWDSSTTILFNGVPASPLTSDEMAQAAVADNLVSTPQTIYRKVPAGAKTGYVVSQTGGYNLISTKEFLVLKPPTIDDMQPTFWNTLDPTTPRPPSITFRGNNFVEYPQPTGSANPNFLYTLNYNGVGNLDSDLHGANAVESKADANYYGNGLSHYLAIFLNSQVKTGPITVHVAMLNPNTKNYDTIADLVTPTFTVIRQPVITDFSPKMGKAGDPVTITGNYFDASNPLNNIVKFAGLSDDRTTVIDDSAQAAVRSVASDGTSITVVVPSNAVTGHISVTVGNLTAQSADPFTVLPSVTIVPTRGSIRAGTNPQTIKVSAVVGGLLPGVSSSLAWSAISSDKGKIDVDPDDPGNTLKRVYTPPATAPAEGIDASLSASTYASVTVGGTIYKGNGSATYHVLPPLSISVYPSLIDVPDPSQKYSVTLTASQVGGVDVSKIQWSIGGTDLLNNGSFGSGSLSATTGPTTVYTAPLAATKATVKGYILASDPDDSTVFTQVPVTLHQPQLKFLGYDNSKVSQNSATISWTMWPGQNAITYLEYGAQPGNYTSGQIANVQAPGQLASVGSAVLTNLKPNTHYYFRITASAPGYAGATIGGDFTTLQRPVITISPSEAYFKAGGDPQVFTATIQNNTTGTVIWSVNHPTDVNIAQIGNNQNQVAITVLSSATPGEVILLTADPNGFVGDSGNASLYVLGNISIAVNPNTFAVAPSQSRTVSVTVTGAFDSSLKTSLATLSSVTTDPGTLVQSATDKTLWTYTAPADTLPAGATPDFTLASDPALPVKMTFTSVEDPTKSASILASVSPPIRVYLTPTADQQVKVGTKLPFTSTVRNSTSKNVFFYVNGVLHGNDTLGTIKDTGEYTAPAQVPSPDTVQIYAASASDSTKKSASVNVKILPSVTVTVSPTTQNVGLGQTYKFAATVTGLDQGADTSVVWSVNGVQNGNATIGTIDADGTYHAPKTMPASPSVTISATSNAVPSATPGYAAVVLQNGVVVQVSASSSSVNARESISIVATVSNATNKGVVWSVNGVTGGNETVGTINPTYPATIYKAPKYSLANPVTITATSVQDPTAAGSIPITVSPRPTVISPANPIASQGNAIALLFQDALDNSVISNATWTVVEGSVWGTIDAKGNYTAPSVIPDPAYATIKATSLDDSRMTATTRVAIVPKITVKVKPSEVTLNAGEHQTFAATDDQGNALTGVTWILLSPTSGGGAIDRDTGEYVAPDAVAAAMTVTIEAVAQTGDTGTAVIHLGATVHIPNVNLLSGPTVGYIANDARSVDISWKTDVASDSQVELGSQSGVYATKFSSGDAVTDHLIRVTGLTPGATYHYRVHSSATSYGDLITSDATFTARGEFVLDISPRVATASIAVDGTSYDGTQMPRTFVWPVGEKHAIVAAGSYQTGVSSRAIFSGWDDKTQPNNPSVTVSIPTSGQGALTAQYTLQYKLDITTDPIDLYKNGKGPLGSDYYNSGQTASISAQVTVPFAGQTYQFVNWKITKNDKVSASKDNPYAPTMDAPVSMIAIYAQTDQEGPAITDIVAAPNPTAGAKTIRLQATASDIGLGDSSIKAMEYSIDAIPTAGNGVMMTASDGAFDNVQESASASIDISTWKTGDKHLIYVNGEDANGNWGDAVSYEMIVTAETVAPSAVNDLRAKTRSTTQIDLSWTAPGDNGATGQADHYDIRYSKTAITNDTFASATSVSNPPKPKVAGSAESLTVSGLQSDTRYYFAMKTYDAAGNVSLLSNVVNAITLGTPPTVSSTSPKDGDTGVAVDAPITITFSKAMDPSTVQVTISPTLSVQSQTWSADGMTLTLAHDAFQGDGTSYSVTVAAGEDPNGNKLASPYAFAFITYKAAGGLAVTPWPMYRHDPQHTGRNDYSGPATPVTGVTWAAQAPSQFSSPAVGIDRTIYVGSLVNGLVAVTPDNQIKWKALSSSDWVHSSPAISKDGTIYIGLPSGVLYAMDASGNELWERALEGAIVSSPAVGDDGTIYVGALNSLYAITPGNQLKWKFSTLRTIFSSPAVGADGTVYIGSEDGALYAVNSDGSQKWFYQTSGGVRSSPMVIDDTVYFGSFDYNFYAINIADGSVKWAYQTDRDIASSPAQGADGNLYIASESGILYCLNPKGELQWRTDTQEVIEGSPSVDKNGVIYLGTTSSDGSKGQLYAFEPQTGKTIWELTDLSPISSSPIIGADGTLYVGSGDNLLLVGQEQTATPAYALGDLNGDGKVSIQDATLSLRIAVGLLTPTDLQKSAGDVNKDGKLSIQDTTLILRVAVGLATF